MNNLLKTTAAISTTEIALMAVALIRNKYLAVNIGPEGFGIYGILNSFFSMIAVFAGIWMATGTMKYVSEYDARGERRAVNTVFTFSVLLAGSIAFVLTLILICKRRWFIAHFLSDDVREIYYLIFAVSFIAMNLRPILLSVLQGQKKIREVVICRWGIALIDIIFVIILVYFWGLAGFFVSILVNSILAVGFLYWGAQRKNGVQFFKLSLRNPAIYSLLSFGGVNLFLAFINLLSQYLQRMVVIQNMDIAAVGIFQAGVGMMRHLGVINRGAQFFYFPKMSEIMDDDVRNRNINYFLRITLMFGIPLSVAALLFGKWIIMILYSSRFLSLAPIFFLFVIGQFISSIGGAFQAVVVGMTRLKMHTFTSIVIHSLWVIVPVLLISRYGVGALGIGFVLGGMAGAIMNWLYLKRYINLRFNQDVFLLFIIAVITLSVAVLISENDLSWRIAWAILTAGLVGKMVRREEWMKGYNYLLVKLGKRER